MALRAQPFPLFRGPRGGLSGTRTHDIRLAKPALSQLSYEPVTRFPRVSSVGKVTFLLVLVFSAAVTNSAALLVPTQGLEPRISCLQIRCLNQFGQAGIDNTPCFDTPQRTWAE